MTRFVRFGVAGVAALAVAGLVPVGTAAAGSAAAHGMRTKAGHASSSSGNLSWHGGPVLHVTKVVTVYWGSSWTASGAIPTGMQTFYSGFGGSTYSKIADQYTDSTGSVGESITFLPNLFDSSRAPNHTPSTSAIVAEAAKEVPAPTAGEYIVVSTDLAYHANYCGWHTAATIGGQQVEVGFIYNLTGVAGCNPNSTVTSNEGLAAMANVAAHELMETRTDPQLNAWYDNGGQEIGDKCAWIFDSPSVSLGGTSWKLQDEWSNAANKGAGGCVEG